MYGLSDLDSLLNRAVIRLLVDVGFSSKLFSSGRVAFCDEVFHDQIIDVSATIVSLQCLKVPINVSIEIRCVRKQNNFVLFKCFQRDSHFVKVHPCRN